MWSTASRGPGTSICCRHCTCTIREPHRRVSTMRRKSVGRAGAYCTQWRSVASQQGQLRKGRRPGLLTAHHSLCPKMFPFSLKFLFRRMISSGTSRGHLSWWLSNPWNNKIAISDGSQIRVGCWPQTYLHLSFVCYLVLSPIILERGEYHWGPWAKTGDTQSLASPQILYKFTILQKCIK